MGSASTFLTSMGTIYRKTAKGHGEIETRANRLSPRMRSTLILVNGSRSDDELRGMIAQQCDEILAALQADGYIEPVGRAEAPPATIAAPAQPRPVPSQPRSPSPASPVKLPDHASLRREVVRALTDQLGPMGETLAIRIERSRDFAELKPLIENAVQAIGNVRGSAAAAAFRARFLQS
jgi:hypothetical protein